MENYYQILGVPPTASADEIRSRYRFLAKAYHPDRFSDPETKAQAEAEMKRVNEAYSLLSNLEKRQKYDRETGAAHGPQGSESADREDRGDRGEKMLQYLHEVEQRWWHLLNPFPHSEELADTRKYFFQRIFVLLDKIYGKPSYEQIRPIADDIETRLNGLIITNICLGAEYEKNGEPLYIKPVDLQIVSSLPLQEKIYQLFAEGDQRKRLTKVEIEEMGETFAKILFILCEQSQALGINVLKSRSNQAAASAAAQAASSSPGAGSATRAGSATTAGAGAGASSAAGARQANQPPHQATEQAAKRTAAPSPAGKFCQACGQTRPTADVTFRQNIGLIILRFHRKIEGHLCADCIEKYFWEMTGITLLFGWWGVISFIASPFIILMNIGSYLSAWEVRKSSKNLGSIALLWKFSTLAAVAFVAYLIILSSSRASAAPVHTYQPQPTVAAAYRVIEESTATLYTPPILKPDVYTPPTDSTCNPWRDIRATDKGKNLCVYGTVKKAYWGNDVYYMTFDDDPKAFRLIVLDGYYFKDIQGNCVKIQGTVKTYGDMPYIEVGDNLWKCQ